MHVCSEICPEVLGQRDSSPGHSCIAQKEQASLWPLCWRQGKSGKQKLDFELEAALSVWDTLAVTVVGVSQDHCQMSSRVSAGMRDCGQPWIWLRILPGTAFWVWMVSSALAKFLPGPQKLPDSPFLLLGAWVPGHRHWDLQQCLSPFSHRESESWVGPLEGGI